MLEARYMFDQEIWWKPNCGHSRVWFDNWTQLGALHYFMPITGHLNLQLDEVRQLFSEELLSNTFN
ncbi:hypothetical protein RDI58_013210 [Solanum bulbocastanum]|uniref:Uncharacterized protein n=1 Tax=Solanum bulbocastanum TaxID=147425 RepID=A0AAN8TT61_SOLBU